MEAGFHQRVRLMLRPGTQQGHMAGLIDTVAEDKSCCLAGAALRGLQGATLMHCRPASGLCRGPPHAGGHSL